MFYLLLVFILATVLTFIYGFFRKKMSRGKKDSQFLFKIHAYYLHHSIVGLIIMLLPLFRFNIIFFYLGLGIVIGHGFEEIYFGNKDLKTFFTFISK